MKKNKNKTNSKPSMDNSNKKFILYGKHPVIAALKNSKRKIFKIYTDEGNLNLVKKICKEKNLDTILIKKLDKRGFEELLPSDAIHQGIATLTQALPPVFIEDIINSSKEKENCNIVILDGVTDPHNIGAIIRTAAAFDSLAIICQEKNSPSETGVLAKSAVGTLENMPICKVTNIARAIEKLQKAGFWSVGMDGYATKTLAELNPTGKIALIMGSEGKGMRKLVEENCDMIAKLPISKSVESLNVSNACAIALYELNRK